MGICKGYIVSNSRDTTPRNGEFNGKENERDKWYPA